MSSIMLYTLIGMLHRYFEAFLKFETLCKVYVT